MLVRIVGVVIRQAVVIVAPPCQIGRGCQGERRVRCSVALLTAEERGLNQNDARLLVYVCELASYLCRYYNTFSTGKTWFDA